MRRRLKTTEQLLDEIRTKLHDDVDKMLDHLPDMIDRANQPDHSKPSNPDTSDPQDRRPDPSTIRATGDHNDPTGRRALRGATANLWIDQMWWIFRQFQVLNAQAENELGPAICRHCRKDLLSWQRTVRIDGAVRHAHCRHWTQSSRFATLPAAE